MQTEEMLSMIVGALQNKKGIRISTLEVGEVSPVCDCFVVVSGSNQSQLDALSDGVEETMHKAGISLRGREGDSRGGWILLDYSDIVVHIFSEEMRDFYQLERSWRDVRGREY